MLSGGFRFALPTLQSAMTKEKGSGTPTDVFSQPPHLAMRRAPLSRFPPPLAGEGREGARSPIGVPPRLLPSGLSALGRSSRPGFLGRGRTFDPVSSLQPGSEDLAFFVQSGKWKPVFRKDRPNTRALPAPACPSPGNAPPGPVVVPVSMMPEAARVRSVSFRARAPHSLRLREYPRPKASFTERDSRLPCN